MIDKKIIVTLSLLTIFVSVIAFVNVVGIGGADAETSDSPSSFTADNGIVYSLDDTKLTATVSDGKKCIGDIVIPSSIFIDGKKI